MKTTFLAKQRNKKRQNNGNINAGALNYCILNYRKKLLAKEMSYKKNFK